MRDPTFPVMEPEEKLIARAQQVLTLMQQRLGPEPPRCAGGAPVAVVGVLTKATVYGRELRNVPSLGIREFRTLFSGHLRPLAQNDSWEMTLTTVRGELERELHHTISTRHNRLYSFGINARSGPQLWRRYFNVLGAARILNRLKRIQWPVQQLIVFVDHMLLPEPEDGAVARSGERGLYDLYLQALIALLEAAKTLDFILIGVARRYYHRTLIGYVDTALGPELKSVNELPSSLFDTDYILLNGDEPDSDEGVGRKVTDTLPRVILPTASAVLPNSFGDSSISAEAGSVLKGIRTIYYRPNPGDTAKRIEYYAPRLTDEQQWASTVNALDRDYGAGALPDVLDRLLSGRDR